MNKNLTAQQRRLQYDAERIWAQHLPALKAAAASVGGMQWKQAKGRDYLIRHWNDRSSGKKRSLSLGVRSPETEKLYAAFFNDRVKAEAAVAAVELQLTEFRELTKAFRLPRFPPVVTDVLRWFAITGLDQDLAICSRHALFAYGAEDGVQFDAARGELGALEVVVFVPDLDAVQDGIADAIFSAVRGARYDKDRFVVERAAGVISIVPRSVDQIIHQLSSHEHWNDDRDEVLRDALDLDPIQQVCIGDDGGPVPVTAIHPKALLYLAISLEADAALNEELCAYVLDEQITFDRHELDAFPELDVLVGDASSESPRL